MDITMHTIKAGPDGCADAGETIKVSPTEGQALIDGKFATKAKRRFPGGETAMIDPKAVEQKEREDSVRQQKEIEDREAEAKAPANVEIALQQLDPAEDEDWTGGGKPAMDRVKTLTGSLTLTRAELDTMFPDSRRPLDPDSSSPIPLAASGARSNKP